MNCAIGSLLTERNPTDFFDPEGIKQVQDYLREEVKIRQRGPVPEKPNVRRPSMDALSRQLDNLEDKDHPDDAQEHDGLVRRHQTPSILNNVMTNSDPRLMF